ncbi:MAG: Crp/Fnr family transcriptional regulator [Anaerolineae bacterium]|jgi:CRP-like cAMP-binding protein
MKTDAEMLRRIALFADLPDETLSRVAGVSIRRTYAPEETIILEGEPCRAAYFVYDGHVRVLRTSPDGREQVLSQLGPGHSFNTVPPFRPGGVNHATAQAVDSTTLYAVPKEDLLRLVTACPNVALALLQDFADRLDHLTDLVEDLSLRTVRGRLARFLLRQAEADSDAVAREWTQAEMAARLGTVREMIGRTLRSFADAGLIKFDRQRIELLDREGLEEEAYG